MGYYCGIDLASKRTAICVIDKARRVKKEVEVATETKAIADALSGYDELTCIVEAAPLAEWLCREVEAMGHKISIVCPRKAKVALASQGKKKTDRRDTRALAELCRSDWYEAVHRKSAEARDMRSYMTARKRLVQASGALASSIRGILRAHGIRIRPSANISAFCGHLARCYLDG